MKTAQDFLKEANEIVEKIDTLDAIKKHGSDETIFIDVRDSGDIQKTGTIKDALTIPRGFIEFAADDQTPYFNTKLNKNIISKNYKYKTNIIHINKPNQPLPQCEHIVSFWGIIILHFCLIFLFWKQ